MRLEPCKWQEAKAVLSPILGDYAAEVHREVLAGREAVFTIGESVTLLRVEQYPNGDLELVAVGFVGDLRQGAKVLFDYGQQLGCRFIRCHTQRPAQLRFLKMIGLPVYPDGWDEDGYLMIKAEYGREK